MYQSSSVARSLDYEARSPGVKMEYTVCNGVPQDKQSFSSLVLSTAWSKRRQSPAAFIDEAKKMQKRTTALFS